MQILSKFLLKGDIIKLKKYKQEYKQNKFYEKINYFISGCFVDGFN